MIILLICIGLYTLRFKILIPQRVQFSLNFEFSNYRYEVIIGNFTYPYLLTLIIVLNKLLKSRPWIKTFIYPCGILLFIKCIKHVNKLL